jgi:hypothetical protein
MTGVVQIFEASSPFQVMVLAAALDSGAFPPAERRILLTSVNSAFPEVGPRLEDDAAVASLVSRFDSVASFNELIFPLHPKGFLPRPEEAPLFERAFRRALDIPAGDQIELALESIHTAPARTLLNVFAESPATVYAEGLMSYGPTRDRLNPAEWTRIQRVLHLDLVEGLTPILLSEFGVPSEIIDAAAFRAVVGELAGPRQDSEEPYALVLGQYLADLGITSADREAEIYRRCVGAAAAHGLTRVVYKPHPSAPPSYTEALRRFAAALGIRFAVHTDPVPVEVLYERRPPALVVGCFSTGLATASRLFDIPVLSTGTREILRSLPRFEDSNRIPLVLTDLTVAKIPDSERPEPPPPSGLDRSALQRVLSTVSYCMQWRARSRFRDDAVSHLRDADDAVDAYIPRRRLRLLLLPGGVPFVATAHTFRVLIGLLGAIRRRQRAVGAILRRLGFV